MSSARVSILLGTSHRFHPSSNHCCCTGNGHSLIMSILGLARAIVYTGCKPRLNRIIPQSPRNSVDTAPGIVSSVLSPRKTYASLSVIRNVMEKIRTWRFIHISNNGQVEPTRWFLYRIALLLSAQRRPCSSQSNNPVFPDMVLSYSENICLGVISRYQAYLFIMDFVLFQSVLKQGKLGSQ